MDKKTRKPIHVFLLCSLIVLIGGLGLAGLALADDFEEQGVRLEKTVGAPEFPRPHTTGTTRSLDVPVNDQCSGALTIDDGPYPICSPITTGMLMAGPDPGSAHGDDPDDGCYPDPSTSNAANTIWYVWTPSATAYYNLNLCDGDCPGTDSDDTLMTIYTAPDCNGPFTAVGCDDDGCGGGNRSKIGPISLEGGITYYIVVGNWTNGGSSGAVDNVELKVSLATPPANDVCAGAEVLALNAPLDGGINALATDNYRAPTTCFTAVEVTSVNVSAGTSGRDVTYVFTAPSAGKYSINLKAFSTGSTIAPNAVLYLSGTCPESDGFIPSCITAANRTGSATSSAPQYGGSESTSCVSLTEGQTVWAIVDATSAGTDEVRFEIEATRCVEEREPNGNVAQAESSMNSAFAGCPLDGRIFTIPSVFTDVDYYALGSWADGHRLFASVDGQFDQDAMNTPTTGLLDMRLVDATNTIEFDDADMPGIHGQALPAISGRPLPADVPLYLRVNHAVANSAWEPYRLQAIVRGGTPYQEPAEPHGSGFGVDYISGHADGRVGTAADQDRFWYCAKQGDQIMINYDSDPERDGTATAIALFGYDGTGGGADGQGFQWPSPPGLGFLFGASSIISPAPGIGHSATTPRSTGPAIVGMAKETGLRKIQVNDICQYLCADAADPACSDPANCSGLTNTTGTYMVQISVNCQPIVADVALTKEGPAEAVAGGIVEYHLHASNNGTNGAVIAGILDLLPAGAHLVGVEAPPEWDCYDAGDGYVECDELTLCFEGSADITLAVQLPYCFEGEALNEAIIFSRGSNTNPDNDYAYAVTNVTDPGCDDGSPCTEDLCDPFEGCYYVGLSDLPCNDSNACTTVDTCADGVCVGSVPPNCNDGNNSTDDSCDPGSGCVNACNGSGNQKGMGWWKRLCRGPHPSGEFLSDFDVACVNDTCTFANVGSVSDICNRLSPDPQNDKCEQAEAQLMTLLLNDCRCLVGHNQPIDATCGPGTTVAQAIADADARLCSPDRDHQTCILAHCSADQITSGAALWGNSLRLQQQGNGTVRLSWQAPYSSPDGTIANVRTYRIWARGNNESSFVLVGEVSGSTLNFNYSGPATNTFFEVTPTW